MPPKGPYKLYYDKKFTRTVPRSTMYYWRQRAKNKQNNKQLHNRFAWNVEHVNDQSPSLSNIDNEVIAAPVLDMLNPMLSKAMNIPFDEGASERPVYIDFNSEKKKKTFSNVKEKLKKNICNCTDVNVAEVLLLFMTIMKKHSLTWIALFDIFEVLNYIFKRKLLPCTKYSLKKLLDVNNESLTNHIICDKCNRYVKQVNASNFSVNCLCGAKIESSSVGSFFIQINPAQQLKKLFEDPIVQNGLEERMHRNISNESVLEDIFDGIKYKEYSINPSLLGNKYNFSYTFNTDGCKSLDNSKVTIWPIFMMIHEFPHYLRKNCMPLVGLWVAKKEPDMKIFLQPFVGNANELSTEGLSWNCGIKHIKSKFFPLGCCVDSPARAAMLNMKRFNGIYGCTYCEHPTESVNGTRKYTMLNDPPSLRTHDSIKQKMITVHESGKSDMGVLGPSPLMYLKHFDLAKGMVLDFMHSCLLGVTELHMTILMSNANKDYYIGSPANIHLINEKLLSIKPPSCIARFPRDIKEISKWKASQWLSWLIFYSLICLQGILPVKFYNHWALFVAAMNILLEDSITPEMLRIAAILLIKFVYYFEQLYGKQYMHYNVHLLLHLKDTVACWGPLWANSTFDFENQNRLLLKKKKCNNRIAQQIICRLLIYQQLPLLENRNFVSDNTRNICVNIRNHNRLKKFVKIGSCNLLGSGKIYMLSNLEKLYLTTFLNISNVTQCTEFSKIIYNGCRYTSCSYKPGAKTNDSVFQSKDGDFGEIQKICKIEYNHISKVFIFFKKLEIDNSYIVHDADVCVTHLKPCTMPISNDFDVIICDDIYRPCILMKIKNQVFVGPVIKAMIAKNVN